MTAGSSSPTADDLVEALNEAGGVLDDEGRRIALTTYGLLTRRRPVNHRDVAVALELSVGVVDRHFEAWPGVFRNDEGSIVGFWGLALEPLDPEYRLRSPSGELLGYAWCAWDTLFLPTLLNRTLEVAAWDGETGEAIGLTVAADGVRRHEPADTVVSILVPSGPWDADVLTSFCHKVLFFADVANAERWISRQDEPLVTLSVAEAFEIGRRWTQARYGGALG